VFTVVTTESFLERVRKFLKKNPKFKSKLEELINDLIVDPFQLHIKLHPLKGKLKGLYAISLTFSYRITLTIEITQKEIILLDIGSHDEVYRE
jgi:addiction module RelE/StbE family toxin